MKVLIIMLSKGLRSNTQAQSCFSKNIVYAFEMSEERMIKYKQPPTPLLYAPIKKARDNNDTAQHVHAWLRISYTY